MTFTIPILAVELPAGDKGPPTIVVRPLFQTAPEQRAEKLTRALARLAGDLQELLHTASEEPRHDALATWAFNPLVETTTVDLRLELDSGSHRRSFFLAGYEALDRRLYFTPALPHLQFEVMPGQAVEERAAAVLTRYFRELERESGAVDLDDYALTGRARLTSVEVRLNPATIAKKPPKPTRALLFGGEEKKDGERELRHTGRLLNDLYPDDLDRAVGREAHVTELGRCLASADRRPLLLVGPRKAGKTAIVHEVAWRIRAQRQEKFGGGRQIWLLSPMRLISGMSYLGEWESRVLAILEHAKKADRVLYFDDLLGLFTAGKSAASDLNVAQVLKPWLEKRAVRVLGEITPEAWRVLREQDRALADLFHVLPVHETSEPETVRILIDQARRLEEEHRCQFQLDVVPTVCDLHRRFVPDAAFPGKAAGFLRQLAVRFNGVEITRELVHQEFHARSGLRFDLFSRPVTVNRDNLGEALEQMVAGQPHALAAFADILLALNARLNDPRRPLGTLLLLGPTGVGKTQAAKALANLLFNSPDRLLRFDMNEFVEAGSAARLTGTARDPEGLLTGAVRRQPFSVLLFDEIEKAAPEVFDLLLAVLDEGRLTDSLGRVADFTQCVILLTSNLGARESRSRLGFATAHSDVAAEDALYTSAAEKFFRPEFFNRIDRVIPFRSLAAVELEKIANQLVRKLVERDGLKRRNGLLNVTPAAMARLVELGHHPQLGARALKRVVEREVAQPLAEKLATLPPGVPMLANLDHRAQAFTLELRDLSPVRRTVTWPATAGAVRAGAERRRWLETLLDGAGAAIDRIEAALAEDAPPERISVEDVSPAQAQYFFCREQFKKVERLFLATERSLAEPRRTPGPAGKLPRAKPVKLLIRHDFSGNARASRLRAAESLKQGLAELGPDPEELADSPAAALLRELALLQQLATKPFIDAPALVEFQVFQDPDYGTMFEFSTVYATFLSDIWSGSMERLWTEKVPMLERLVERSEGRYRKRGFFLRGINLQRLLPATECAMLLQRKDGNTGLVTMTLKQAANKEEARRLFKQGLEQESRVTPERIGPVTHTISHDAVKITDHRTGIVTPAEATPQDIRALLLSALPLPPELDDAFRD